MCFAVSPLLAAGIKAGSAALSALQQREADRFRAAMAENQAATALRKAGAEADRIRKRGDADESKLLARLAKAGVDPGASASAGALVGENAAETERDALAALYSGRLSADAARSRAMLSRAQGRRRLVSGAIGAGSTLLTGLSRPGGGSRYGAPLDLIG